MTLIKISYRYLLFKGHAVYMHVLLNQLIKLICIGPTIHLTENRARKVSS